MTTTSILPAKNTSHNYVVDGIRYAECFPVEWATNHTPGTGPRDCEACSILLHSTTTTTTTTTDKTKKFFFVHYCPDCCLRYAGARGNGYQRLGINTSLLCSAGESEMWRAFPYTAGTRLVELMDHEMDDVPSHDDDDHDDDDERMILVKSTCSLHDIYCLN